jgi:spore maturation protein CgeB
MRKVLVVHPGASTSIHDTYVGMVEAWRASGPVAEFRLDGRLEHMQKYLHVMWRHMKKTRPEQVWPKPNQRDVFMQATWGLVERALQRQCDAILVVSAMFLNPEALVLARRAGLKVYLLCTESPYELPHETQLAGLADGVWTNERSAVPVLQHGCPFVSYLPHAWRVGVHDVAQRGDQTLPSHDVVFIGTYFPERIALLESVDWTGIDLGLYGNTDMIPGTSSIWKYVRGGVTPNPIAAGYYRRAKIGLNLFRTSPAGFPAAESANPRTFELAASGVCQVSEFRDEVGEVFGETVPTFRTGGELGDLVRALLADEGRRGSYGAGAKAAVSDQTWTSRVEQMRRDLHQWAEVPALQHAG